MRYAIKLALFCLSLSSTLFAADYRFIKIDFPNASETIASGINARGHVVGRYDDFNGVVHGFLLRNGTFTTIDVPGASFTSARAINARGTLQVGCKMQAASTTRFYSMTGSSPRSIFQGQFRPLVVESTMQEM
jgi:probable HAF family extracellular repeat protein